MEFVIFKNTLIIVPVVTICQYIIGSPRVMMNQRLSIVPLKICQSAKLISCRWSNDFDHKNGCMLPTGIWCLQPKTIKLSHKFPKGVSKLCQCCLKVLSYFASETGRHLVQFEIDPLGLNHSDHTTQDLRTLFFQQTYIISLFWSMI